MNKQNVIELLKEFDEKIAYFVDWYASLLADYFRERYEHGTNAHQMYMDILEMNGGTTVLRNIEALGFEPFKLLEEAMLMCED